MNFFPNIILILLAYFSGAVPYGYLFTKKITGKNVREFGSGNIGSTNVRRVAGAKVGLLTQLCDMLKGLLPVAIVLFLQYKTIVTLDAYIVYIVALATILGHDFSIFLRFKGGKGVNTTLGASVLLCPAPVFISVIVYYIVKGISKYVSISSISLAIILPVSGFIIYDVSYKFYYLFIGAVLIIVMHIPNLSRVLKGIESKWEKK